MNTPGITDVSQIPPKPAPAGPGRIVHYRLTPDDVAKIQRRRTDGASIAARIEDGTWPRGAQAHVGEPVEAGGYYPMIVVRCKDGTTKVNGRVFLDGSDELHVTGVEQGEYPGMWCWPPRT